MYLYISPPKEILTKGGPRGRFSVNVISDDNIPLITMDGWSIDAEGNIRTPAARNNYGREQSWIFVNAEYKKKIQQCLENMEEYKALKKSWNA